ncbi:tyrosine-type recombinase/integrase, partial [Candidatus Gracilibacteria bacterium]|nr:tyrosine-type recombinase/integrase [Candidatus Gracilibacteria bacterium]
SIQPEASKNASFEVLKELEKMPWTKTTQIDQHICDHFRLSLAQGNISITTVNAYMISLRAFLHFCKKTHIPTGIEFSDIELQKNRERKVEYLTGDELQSIIASIGNEDIVDLRDRAIILTIFSTGLRVSELTALDIKNVNLETQEFAILGKGRKVRVVYLTEWACEAIRAYLEKREDHFPPLFIKHGKHFPVDAGADEVRFDRFLVTKMVSDRALKAGIVKPVSAHTIRHSFATTLLGNGADLRSIQELLGHKNIATTQVYTHVTNKQLREVHQKFHV